MAGGDVRLRLEAGQEMPVTTPGDYIFLKFADRDIRVTVTDGQGVQKPVIMKAGDKYRPGPFRALNIENTDPHKPAQIVMVIGEGDFSRQIVQGQITAQLKIRSGDGTFIDDTRKKLAVNMVPMPGSGITENFRQTIKTAFPGGQSEFEAAILDAFGFDPGYIRSIDFNPAVHRLPVVMTTGDGTNYRAFEFDPVRKIAGRSLGIVQDLGQQQGFTTFGDLHFQIDSNHGSEGLYKRVGSGGNWVRVVQLDNPRSLAVLSNGNLVVFASGKVHLVTKDGAILRTESVSSYTRHLATTPDGEVWAFTSANYKPAVFDSELNPIPGRAEGVWGTDGPLYSDGAYFVHTWEGAGSRLDNFAVKARETVSDLFVGKGFRACEMAWLGPKPSAFESVRSGAQVTVSSADTPTPTVEGEVIKLIYEWVTGEAAPTDYMDYLHGIRIEGAVNLNGEQFPVIDIQSSGQTFLAAGIPDNFRVIFPIKATLTVDNRAGL